MLWVPSRNRPTSATLPRRHIRHGTRFQFVQGPHPVSSINECQSWHRHIGWQIIAAGDYLYDENKIDEWKRDRLIDFLAARDRLDRKALLFKDYDELQSNLGADDRWDSENEAADGVVTQSRPSKQVGRYDDEPPSRAKVSVRLI
jgi:hypothetical protein